MRNIRRAAAKSHDKVHSTGLGLSTEEDVGLASQRAAAVVLEHVKPVAKVTDVLTDEGYFLEPKDALQLFFTLHLVTMEGILFKEGVLREDDEGNFVLWVSYMRTQVDGFPCFKNRASYTEMNLGFGGVFACPTEAAQLFCYLLFMVPYGESHRVTVRMIQHMNDGIQAALVEARDGKLMVGDHRLRIGFNMLCTDLSMATKAIRCAPAQSIFRGGYMTQQHKLDFHLLKGKSILDPEFERLHITYQKRKELAAARKKFAASLTGSDSKNEADLDAWAREHRNPQYDDPLAICEWLMHCYLHAKLRLVARNARIIFKSHPQFADILVQHPTLNSIGTDLLKGKASINMTGEMASYYFRNLALLVKPLIKREATSEMALFLTDVLIMFSMRDIIGTLATTHAHTADTLRTIADAARDCFSLQKAVYEEEEVQPYIVSMCVDVPVQLKLLKDYCDSIGDDLDTSDMSAHQLELVNKVCKSVMHKVSSHKHITGEEKDATKHVMSVCFRPFLHQWVTKHMAFVTGMLNLKWYAAEKKRAARNDTQRILPEGDDECSFCGIYIHRRPSAVHGFICEHPLIQDLLEMRKTGQRHGQVRQLLSAQGVQDAIMQRAGHLPPSAHQAQDKTEDKKEDKKTSDSENTSTTSESSSSSDSDQSIGRGRGRGRGRARGAPSGRQRGRARGRGRVQERSEEV